MSRQQRRARDRKTKNVINADFSMEKTIEILDDITEIAKKCTEYDDMEPKTRVIELQKHLNGF